MKRIFAALCVCVVLWLPASSQAIKVFHEIENNVTVLYANNDEYYPASISIEFNLTNMNFSEGNQKVFVVPPLKQRHKIGQLSPAGGRSYKFGYRYTTAYGDVTKKDYDKNYVYDLPFQKGKSFKLFQGYNGVFSHQGENSLDFTMPEGTEILAAREGTVVEVVDQHNQSCPRKECEKYNNYITIFHPDGTFAQYTHIRQNGARFKRGDKVKKGDVIAYSGNVGWSSGPHLHFLCFIGAFQKRETIETQFRIDKGDNATLLKEGGVYTRDY